MKGALGGSSNEEGWEEEERIMFSCPDRSERAPRTPFRDGLRLEREGGGSCRRSIRAREGSESAWI